MELPEKITGSKNYTALAKVLYSHFKTNIMQAIAVRDSLGLWHVYPGKTVLPHARGFQKLGKSERVAFRPATLAKPGRNFKSRCEKIRPLVRLKLEALDTKERLRRLELQAGVESRVASVQLRQLKKKLREEFEGKIRLFSRYSHDLKTPLSMLTIPLEGLILNENSLPAKLRLQLEKIKIAIYTVLRTVGQSLDAARMLTQNRRLILIPCNFSEFVRQVVEVYAIVFESYGIRMETQLEPNVIAEIDPIQMEKIINNLLSNAIKHNIPGGTTQIILRVNGKNTELSITDSGLGGNPADPSENTAPDSPELNPWVFSSHGLGLEIVRDLTRLNRGRLTLTAQKGIGTTALISLLAVPELAHAVHGQRHHNFYYTMHEVELLASERTVLSRRRR